MFPGLRSPFYAVLPLLCIILNTEQRTKIGGGLGRRLKWYQALLLCCGESLGMKATWMDIVNCECTITPKVFCKSKTLNSRYLELKTVMQHAQVVAFADSGTVPRYCTDQNFMLCFGMHFYQSKLLLNKWYRWFPNVKLPTSGGQARDQEAAVKQTFYFERSSFFYLSTLMVRTQCGAH